MISQDRDEEAIEANIAASKGLNSIINNSYNIIHACLCLQTNQVYLSICWLLINFSRIRNGLNLNNKN